MCQNAALCGNGVIATFQLSSVSLNLGRSQNGILRNGLNSYFLRHIVNLVAQKDRMLERGNIAISMENMVAKSISLLKAFHPFNMIFPDLSVTCRFNNFKNIIEGHKNTFISSTDITSLPVVECVLRFSQSKNRRLSNLAKVFLEVSVYATERFYSFLYFS